MSTPSPFAAERERRSAIAALGYEYGRSAALAAARRRSLSDRARARRDEIRSLPHSYEPRTDSRAPGLLDSDTALLRAAAYLAAAGVAHELIAAETFTDPAQQEWATETLNRTAVHVDAWRERLTDNGIDDTAFEPSPTPLFMEMPPEIDGADFDFVDVDFDGIAERTLDVSSTSADVEPIRLSDLMLTAPSHSPSSGSVIDITDRVAEVIEIDRGVGADGGVDPW